MYSLIHKIIFDLPPTFNYSSINGEDIRDLAQIFKDNIIYDVHSLYADPYVNIETINMNEQVRDLLIYCFNLGDNFNLIHFLTVLSNKIDFENMNMHIKHSFILNHYEIYDDVLMNQKHYYELAKRLIENVEDENKINNLSISEYLAYLLYDPLLFKELTNEK